VTYYFDPQLAAAPAASKRKAHGVFLLPGFDEYLLGYQSRGAVLPPEFAANVVPGSNGIFLPIIISDGEVIGTWKRAGTGTNRALGATPFSTFDEKISEAVARVYRALPA
jgi:hypothetical protein